MSDERGVLRRIVWQDVFPGLMLFRCFRLAVTLPMLFLATVGTMLMPIGPRLIDFLFPPTTISLADPEIPIEDVPIGDLPRLGSPDLPAAGGMAVTSDAWPWMRMGIVDAYLSVLRPFADLFNRDASLGQLFRSLCKALWYLLIWSACGGAITRIAVVQLGCRERIPLPQATRHVAKNLIWYVASPLFPLLGIALTAAPLILLGLIMRLDIGVVVAGFLWPLALAAGLVMAILLTGLLFGWPLMWPTISSEAASDSFQAFSSSYSYTFQRPLQYLAYMLIAMLVGGLGGLFVERFSEAVVSLNHWALSFGSGRERLGELLSGELNDTWLVWAGSCLISWGDGLVRTVARAYNFSFFFCAASAIYLLLRREVDQTDFDEINLPEETVAYTLPSLRPGPHGVPEIEAPSPSTDEPLTPNP